MSLINSESVGATKGPQVCFPHSFINNQNFPSSIAYGLAFLRVADRRCQVGRAFHVDLDGFPYCFDCINSSLHFVIGHIRKLGKILNRAAINVDGNAQDALERFGR